MQIIVDISEDEDGRAVGVAWTADKSAARPFSGNLELLALIESLYRISTAGAAEDSCPTIKEQS